MELLDERLDQSTTLAVTGMTCSSCAMRIERKLNKTQGVKASVNYATAQANITHNSSVSVDDLIATIEATGYSS